MIIGHIAAHELRRLLFSPLAWILLAVIQAIAAWMFLTQISDFVEIQSRLSASPSSPGVTDLVVAPFLGKLGFLIVLTLPLLTMRLLSEELRGGSLNLLLSAPVSATQITLGKFLGLLGFLGILLSLLTLLPLSLELGTELDLGKLAAGLLGIALVTIELTAIGLYLSSLTNRPSVAAVASYGVFLFLWISRGEATETLQGSGFFDWISVSHHYHFLLRGLLRTADLIYFALLTTVPLLLTIQRLYDRRLQP